MEQLSFIDIGSLSYDVEMDEHRSKPMTVAMLGRDDAEFVIVGYVDDPTPQDFQEVVRNVLSRCRETLLDVSADLQRYFLDMNQFREPQQILQVETTHDLWSHVHLGREIYIKRRLYGDRKLYVSIECGCEWEVEHGLQIVLREGLVVSKIGPYDGHLSNADSFGDPSLESVVYRCIG